MATKFVTEPETTGLIYAKCSYYDTYLVFWMGYSQSVGFIKFLIDFYMHDKIYAILLYFAWADQRVQQFYNYHNMSRR